MKDKTKRGFRMVYLLLPVVAGLCITLQGTFSSRMGNETGFYETIILIHLFGLIASLILYIFVPHTSGNLFSNLKVFYVIAGMLGVFIVFFTAKSISLNGVLITIMISVLIQMITSKVIEHFGLFGVPQVPVDLRQIIAILLMFVGVIVYQSK